MLAPPGNLSDAQALFQTVALVVAVIVSVSILMMLSMHRNQSCPKCGHCKDIIRKKQEAKAKELHEAYHHWTDRRASDCQDEDCLGRK